MLRLALTVSNVPAFMTIIYDEDVVCSFRGLGNRLEFGFGLDLFLHIHCVCVNVENGAW